MEGRGPDEYDEEMTNLAPLPPGDWDEEILHLKDGFAGRLNVYRVMAHNPPLLAAWAGLRQHVVVDNALGPELTEVAILRISVHLNSDYERAHHVVRARACGMSDARIARILAQGIQSVEPDAIIVRAVDELARSARLESDTIETLVGLFGRRSLLDLFAIYGFYSTLGFIANSCETPIDDDIAAQLGEKGAL